MLDPFLLIALISVILIIIPADLLSQVLVILFECVCLLVKQIHEVVETVVLFLCLDECGHDLLDARDACGLLDLVEGVLNDASIPDVLVQQLLLLFVGDEHLVDSQLEDGDGISELLLLSTRPLGRVHHCLVETLVIELYGLVSLLEALL
jgi:hypothetical protein